MGWWSDVKDRFGGEGEVVYDLWSVPEVEQDLSDEDESYQLSEDEAWLEAASWGDDEEDSVEDGVLGDYDGMIVDTDGNVWSAEEFDRVTADWSVDEMVEVFGNDSDGEACEFCGATCGGECSHDASMGQEVSDEDAADSPDFDGCYSDGSDEDEGWGGW